MPFRFAVRLAFALSLVLALPSQGALGDLDPAFGTSGSVVVSPVDPDGPGACTRRDCGFQVKAMAVQPDGRIVVVGELFWRENSPLDPFTRWVVLRRLADGAPDASFGSAGVYFLPQERFSSAGAVALRSDGRILVAGRIAATVGGAFVTAKRAAVLQLLGDGTPDPAFGTNGLAEADLGDTRFLSVDGLAIAPDGRIHVSAVDDTGLFVVRLMPDGLPDPSFGAAGIANLSFAGTPHSGEPTKAALALQPDGRALVGTTLDRSEGVVMGAVRALPDGSLDASFNGTGRLVIDTPPASRDVLGGIALQPDGRFLIAGASGLRGLVLRRNPDGSPDTGFGSGGVAFTGHVDEDIEGVALQPDGRIVVAGNTFAFDAFFHAQDTIVTRWLPDGTPDRSFGGMGRVQLNFGGGHDVGALAIQPDGKILVAGVDWQAFLPYGSLRVSRYLGASTVLDDARLFVMQLYGDFLSRAGDEGGIRFWSDQVFDGARSRVEVLEAFLRSGEFEDAIAPAARLYLAYFLRIPDYGGLRYWIDHRRAGHSLEEISQLFAGSPEFNARYGPLDNAGFVTLVYLNVLGRGPDAAGHAFWTSQLDGGAMTRGEVMLRFSEANEFRAVSANEVFVVMSFFGILARAPDAAELAAAVDALDAGGAPRALLESLLESDEYRARFGV